MRGKLIVIEGVDGAGKTTQIDLLAERLKKEGINAVKMKFPQYDKFFGRQIKGYLFGELGTLEQVHPKSASVWYALDRMEGAKEIKNTLENGTTILCDRYYISNVAHQGAKIKDEAKRKEFLDWLDELEHKHLGVVKEDFVVFLDLPQEFTSDALAKHGKELDIHEKNKEYLAATREMYLKLSREMKNMKVINCMKSASQRKSIGEVSEDIWNSVKEAVK